MILASASPLSVTLAIGAAVAYGVSAVGAARLGSTTARAAVRLGWLLHGLVLLWSMFGEAPRFGFAPALSVTAWLVAAVYAVESRLYPLLQTRWALSALGAVVVLLALFFPGSQLPASASPWVPLHRILGIASYGLFGAAVVHAWFMTRTEERIRLATDTGLGMPLLTMERLTFRFVGAGFLLLSATLLLGLVFGNLFYDSATPLKFNHKTAFSVLSWLTFAVLLIGRARFGWRGRQAVRVLYIGTAWLLLAYVGTRFVLEVVLGRTT
ncbi:MAG: cytochrome c biogenesis protein CcsA [Gammaproteobacteria bacterium]|uniref:cytochrome C assembly family protein n=1 Tax=Rhodoferax sp. TaxID=50421 RepID=UPI0017A40EFE|nr:cytochrome c biogenesis protein CcsA [Rhodoferax sp.]MBU3898025.1 cytochrome c biogenesis protein CcsA [Gammaproteobacteria bacterium]MBA3058524.1 cytochrome C assembly protein [Rhodoferax sp.]MBU3999218.1 cytochrome c biogenesis protein CcsA [Gammaproteobacteria bacterium]MBU4081781.1 cytochrome c biogenesis protein CcsA [Gammaproteobacteria bacterium]MBU4112883.1 cytochrome c biogenesis protein CcsA [Gammaproteobacteria bacterium]